MTLGTAGHVDHGKTSLVKALTGIDTDRLPEERRRGMSIELGFASLVLPSGRRLSIVDVPGHERFVRTMVAGATGIDAFLLVVAADDGVMPQTLEHLRVLRGLGVERGVVAITRSDLAEPDLAAAEVEELLPGSHIVACSAITGEGLGALVAALDDMAGPLADSARLPGETVLHIDRVITVHGAGTIVTGTLRGGSVARDDVLTLLPAGARVRVRSVQVHGSAVETAHAGGRVAVNLTGVRRREVHRGDVLASRDAPLRPRWIFDAFIDPAPEADRLRVHVHHGTRATPGLLVSFGGGLAQLRVRDPLLVATGDRIVIRTISPPDTLGGGVVLDPGARRHGADPVALERLRRVRRGEPADPHAQEPAAAPEPPEPPEPAAPEPLPATALGAEDRIRAAGHEPPVDSALGASSDDLARLRKAERIVRFGPDRHIHTHVLADVQQRVERLIERDGAITLAGLRDELGTSRRFAQALLEALDARRVTLRLPDDRRVLRARRRSGGGGVT